MGREKKRAAGAHAQLRKRKEKGDSRERRRYDLLEREVGGGSERKEERERERGGRVGEKGEGERGNAPQTRMRSSEKRKEKSEA